MVRFWYRFADKICSRDLLSFVLLPTNDVSVKLKLDLKVQVITNKLIAIAEQLESWVASHFEESYLCDTLLIFAVFIVIHCHLQAILNC